jgi:hypothetical protein
MTSTAPEKFDEISLHPQQIWSRNSKIMSMAPFVMEMNLDPGLQHGVQLKTSHRTAAKIAA